MGGVDIKAVSEFAGHASAAFTLETCTHLTPAAPDRARTAVAASGAQRSSASDGPMTAQETS